MFVDWGARRTGPRGKRGRAVLAIAESNFDQDHSLASPFHRAHRRPAANASIHHEQKGEDPKRDKIRLPRRRARESTRVSAVAGHGTSSLAERVPPYDDLAFAPVASL